MTLPESAHDGPCGKPVVQGQPMFHRVFRAQSDAVRSVLIDVRRRFAGEVCDDTLGRLELVLAEVINNVTEHGTGRAIKPPGLPGGTAPLVHLCIVGHDSGLACAITDDGPSVPDECLLPRDLPQRGLGDLPEGGFGWFLIQDLTQALCYYREDRRNFLAFSVPYGRASGG